MRHRAVTAAALQCPVMGRRLLSCLLVIAVCALLSAQPARPSGGAPATCVPVTAATADECLRLNHLQVLGTHNSYHVEPPAEVLAALGDRGTGLRYTHRPLAQQLSGLGIRKLEIDVYADPEGGRYAEPAALRLAPSLSAGWPADALRAPGFKVLHVHDVDVVSRCPTLRACLREVRDWSRAHPRHVPLMVMIELKDTPLKEPRADIGAVPPLPIDGAQLDALDREIRDVFPREGLLMPDDVRGKHATLRDAIATDGWPRLRDARGKVLFAMDNTGHHRDLYLRDRPSLEGRVLFVSAEPGAPAAAFLKLNDALGDGEARIRAAVAAGYIVRTRADEPIHEATTGDTRRRDAAFRSGAQYVSTDFPEPAPFPSRYVARLPGAERRAARCNPVSAPPGCRDVWLEP